VAIDRSTPYRGLAVVALAQADALAAADAIGVYRPTTVSHKPL
jgi:hypothetical protein